METENNFIPEARKANLLSIGKWTKFLGILYGVMIPALFIGGVVFTVLGALGSIGDESYTFLIIGPIYIVVAVILIFPTLYTLRGADNFLAAARNDDEAKFDEGLANYKSLAKFYGIYVIVSMAVAVVGGLVAAILIAVFA